MTNFNERTNTLLYKNIIPHTLFLKGWCWLCERWAGDGDRLLYWPSSTSFSSWLGCSTVSHWGPKPSVCKLILTLASCLPTDSKSNRNSNWLTQAVCGTWLYNCFFVHLLPVGVCICTEFNHVHRSKWYSDIFDRMHLFRCSAYLYRCISWLTARSRVNMLQ